MNEENLQENSQSCSNRKGIQIKSKLICNGQIGSENVQLNKHRFENKHSHKNNFSQNYFKNSISRTKDQSKEINFENTENDKINYNKNNNNDYNENAYAGKKPIPSIFNSIETLSKNNFLIKKNEELNFENRELSNNILFY